MSTKSVPVLFPAVPNFVKSIAFLQETMGHAAAGVDGNLHGDTTLKMIIIISHLQQMEECSELFLKAIQESLQEIYASFEKHAQTDVLAEWGDEIDKCRTALAETIIKGIAELRASKGETTH